MADTEGSSRMKLLKVGLGVTVVVLVALLFWVLFLASPSASTPSTGSQSIVGGTTPLNSGGGRGTSLAVPTPSVSPTATSNVAYGSGTNPSNWRVAVPIASRFLNQFLNSPGAANSTPTSWLQGARPLLTINGYKTLAAPNSQTGAGGAGVESITHSLHLNLVTTSTCNPDPSVAAPGPNLLLLDCLSETTTVGANGKPYPLSQIHSIWPYNGTPVLYQLWMSSADGGWLVDGFYTGQPAQ